MKFAYRARDEKGKLVRGEVVAGTASAVAEMVRAQRLTPISIDPMRSGWSWADITAMFGRVTQQEIANFTRQLATMITAGLPITDALNLLRVQSGPAFAPIVTAVLSDVQGGVSLSEALSRHPHVFSKVYISLVRAGEAAGVMETILDRLADNLEKRQEFSGKVITVMIYPAIIIVGMIVVVAIMMLVVVPKLTALYLDFDAELPLATKILIWSSDVAVGYWWLILAVLVVGGLIANAYVKTEAGKKERDRLVYKLPIAGPLIQKIMLTELTRTLGLLVSAGVSVVEALKITSEVVGSSVVEEEVKKIAAQVEKGFPVSISFTDSPLFPPIIGQMVAVGEETGKMDEVLAKLSHYFETDAEQKVKGLTTAIEPLIIMILAVGVGFLMYAIIMPIYTITDSI